MKKIAWALILILVLMAADSGCVKKVVPTTPSVSIPAPATAITPASTPKPTPTPKATPAPTPVDVTTPLARPAAGKSQETSFVLKAPANTYNLVIFLASGETLDLDWKFVSEPQAGIGFMFTTPEGREMDVKSQPLNIPGHPYYDEKVPVKQITEVVGSNLVIKIGKDQYCGEGYYSLVFDGKKVDIGTIYLRYSLAETAVP